jgi:PAS domain S-box-containing protein
MSQISIAGKPGIIIIAKDITIQRMQIHQEGRIDFNASLADNFSIGFFKTTFSRKNRFIEASGAALKIFGFESGEDLLKTTIEDLFSSQKEQKAFAKELLTSGFTRRKMIKIRKSNGKEAYIAVSLIVREAGEGEKFCEGIVEDITDDYIAGKNNEALMQLLLAPDTFLFQPVREFNENPLSCNMYTSINSVCTMMQKYDSSFILIDTPEGNRIGIVTDRDIRNRVVAQGHPLNKPVYEIMTSPVHTLSLDKPLFDAILILHDHQIDTLILTDSLGRPAGAFGHREALRCLEFSQSCIIRKIMRAGSIDEIIDAHRRLK